MAPVHNTCLYEHNQSESENDSGSDSEGGDSSASGSRSSSVDSANNQGQRSSHGSDRSRSPSPADSQASGSSGSQGRRSRRDSLSSASPQKGGGRSVRSLSGSPVDGETKKSTSRSPSPGDQKSGSGSPGRASENGCSRSESPADDKSNVSEKNSEKSRSPSPEVNEARKSRSRSVGSNNSRQSSPASRSGSGESDNESRHSKERSESPVGKDDTLNKTNVVQENASSERAWNKSPSKKSGTQSGSDSEDNSAKRTPRKSVSPKAKSRSGSPEKRQSRSPSSQGQAYRGSDSEGGGVNEPGRKRKRAVLSDDSASDGEKKKLDTGADKDDGDESEKDLVIDAEALFGDASDISSDEEGKKKKGEKKAIENEAYRSQGEESDAGSVKDKSGEDDNEMEVDEKDEEDKENVPEEPMPETRIDVQIPKITTDLGREIHFVKLPNFLSVETRPFDPMTYEDEIDEEETLDEEGRARLKLKVENTIRWREITKQNGEFEKQSNARFVKWSDGSMSLHLGSEIFDVCKQPLQGDHNHLFIRQGTGLQGQAVFRTKLTFRPHSTESFTHRKMTLSLADRSQKTARIKVLSLVGKDPEAHRGELIKKEEEKLKASVRRESKQRRIREKGASRGLSAGYLEPDRYGDGDSDDEGISINAIKKQHKNKLSNSKEDRSHIYSSDEDGSDIETRRARRLDKAKALKDSDTEESGGGDGGGDKSGERSSSGED